MADKKKNNEPKFGLFYGTLRYGEYNFEKINRVYPGSLKFVASKILIGYRMFDIGFYPACIYTGEKDLQITADIVEMTKEAEEYIYIMETSVGFTQYTDKITFKEPITKYVISTKATIYLMKRPQIEIISPDEIYDGDWIEYQKKLTY